MLAVVLTVVIPHDRAVKLLLLLAPFTPCTPWPLSAWVWLLGLLTTKLTTIATVFNGRPRWLSTWLFLAAPLLRWTWRVRITLPPHLVRACVLFVLVPLAHPWALPQLDLAYRSWHVLALSHLAVRVFVAHFSPCIPNAFYFFTRLCSGIA